MARGRPRGPAPSLTDAKACTACGEVKSASEFRVNKQTRRGRVERRLYARCRPCDADYYAEGRGGRQRRRRDGTLACERCGQRCNADNKKHPRCGRCKVSVAVMRGVRARDAAMRARHVTFDQAWLLMARGLRRAALMHVWAQGESACSTCGEVKRLTDFCP